MMAKKEEIGYFTQHWRGDLSLAQSYWVNGVVIGFLFNVFSYVILTAGDPTSKGFILLLIFMIPLIVFVASWQFVGIWRSATKHMQKTKRKFWAITAKVLVVIGVIITAGQLFQTITFIPTLARYS